MTVPILERIPLPPPPPGAEYGDLAVVSLDSELDLNDAPALQAFLSGIRWRGRPRSVIDLTGLAFIDCACLCVLVQHRRDIRAQGGTVDLAGPHGSVHRILSVTGALTLFEAHGTVAQATAGNHGCRYLVFRRPLIPSPPARLSGSAAGRPTRKEETE